MAHRTEWDFTDVTNIVPVIPNEILEPEFDDAYIDLCDVSHAARAVLCDEILRAGRDDMMEAA